MNLDNGCTESDCSVHQRNDMNEVDEYGHNVFITYVGNYAVYTSIAPNIDGLSDYELTSLLLARVFGHEEDAAKILNGLTRTSITQVFFVGIGAISDAPISEPIEELKNIPENSKAYHAQIVEQYRQMV